MTNWTDAVREQLEPDLVCPKCGEVNDRIHRAIRIDDHGRCECSMCSNVGPVGNFTPKEKAC